MRVDLLLHEKLILNLEMVANHIKKSNPMKPYRKQEYHQQITNERFEPLYYPNPSLDNLTNNFHSQPS